MNIKKEKTFFVVLLILGAALILAGIIIDHLSEFDTEGILSGLGGGWVIISWFKLYQIKKHPDRYVKEKTEASDERSIAIRGMASYCTFLLSLILFAILALIFTYLNYTLPAVIAGIAFFIQFVGFIVFVFYYRHKL
jgi:hypothetical protein